MYWQRKDRKIGFSQSQHRQHFRPQVARAWQVHCRRTGSDFFNAAAREHWYRAQLMACLGVYSTQECDAGADFETAMAHFEAIEGCSIRWQLKSSSGDRRRLHFLIRQLAQRLELTEQYVQGIATQMGYGDLETDCTEAQLRTVFQAMDSHSRRQPAQQHQHVGVAS